MLGAEKIIKTGGNMSGNEQGKLSVSFWTVIRMTLNEIYCA